MVSQNTLFTVILFHHLDDRNLTRHHGGAGRNVNNSMANEGDTEPGGSVQENDQPAQIEELVPKRGATSVAWTWFGYEKSDTDQKTVLCKLCRTPVPTTGSNTTNLFYHLRKNHVKEYGQSLQMRGTKEPSGAQNKPQSKTIEQAFACGTPYNRDSRRWQEIREAIATYICKDMAPIYTVEKQGFRALMKKLDSRYTMPSRKHFTQVELPRLYHECRAKVEGEIHQVAYYAMTDMWTSRTIHPYMSLTVHFIQD